MLLCLTALAVGRVWVNGYPKGWDDEEHAEGVLEWLQTIDGAVAWDTLFDGGVEVLTARRVGVEHITNLAVVTGMSVDVCVCLLDDLSRMEDPFLRWTFMGDGYVVAFVLLDEDQRLPATLPLPPGWG